MAAPATGPSTLSQCASAGDVARANAITSPPRAAGMIRDRFIVPLHLIHRCALRWGRCEETIRDKSHRGSELFAPGEAHHGARTSSFTAPVPSPTLAIYPAWRAAPIRPFAMVRRTFTKSMVGADIAEPWLSSGGIKQPCIEAQPGSHADSLSHRVQRFDNRLVSDRVSDRTEAASQPATCSTA